mmetsp:Transcript_116940/g.337969  ORF Transcript_116940/g.337969 Transcript_116940/m.337969 type:complete len:203 (-) Transcript_116940:882-1490(-)
MFPAKTQSSHASAKLPKEMLPLSCGSIDMRHAATVDPYLSFIDCRNSGSAFRPASNSACRFCSDGFVVGDCGSPPWPSPNFFFGAFGCESADFDVTMKGTSPRCFLRVQSGSMSQMVNSFFPGAGCKHWNSLPALNGYESFTHASSKSFSVMHSVGSFPKPNLQASSMVPNCFPNNCRNSFTNWSDRGSMSRKAIKPFSWPP